MTSTTGESARAADASLTSTSQQLLQPQPESQQGQAALSNSGAEATNAAGLNTASVTFPTEAEPTTSASALSVPSPSTSMSQRSAVAHKLQAPLLVGRAISTLSTASDTTSLSLNTEYTGPIIPPASDTRYCDRRTLIVCFDGTGDEFDQDNSNVVSFFSLLKKGDHVRQLVYYQVCYFLVSCPFVIFSDFKHLHQSFAIHLSQHHDTLKLSSPVLVHTPSRKLHHRSTLPLPKHSILCLQRT